MLAHPICGLSGHKINRRRVWHDGISYRTNCDRCDKPMIRDGGGWTPFKNDVHANPARLAKGDALPLDA